MDETLHNEERKQNHNKKRKQNSVKWTSKKKPDNTLDPKTASFYKPGEVLII